MTVKRLWIISGPLIYLLFSTFKLPCESIIWKHKKVKTSDNHLNRELIVLPYKYTRAQVIGKLVDSIMNSPEPKKLKGRFTVTEV